MSYVYFKSVSCLLNVLSFYCIFIANKLSLNQVYMLFYVAVFLTVSNVTISISCKRFTENK